MTSVYCVLAIRKMFYCLIFMLILKGFFVLRPSLNDALDDNCLGRHSFANPLMPSLDSFWKKNCNKRTYPAYDFEKHKNFSTFSVIIILIYAQLARFACLMGTVVSDLFLFYFFIIIFCIFFIGFSSTI